MQLADLKTGMIVITRNHEAYYVILNFMHAGCLQNIFWNGRNWLFFRQYNDDLTCRVNYRDFIYDWCDLTPDEVRNSRRRARYYAKAHDIMEVCLPAKREDFLNYDPNNKMVLWTRNETESDTKGKRVIPVNEHEDSEIRQEKSFHFPEPLQIEFPTLNDLKTGLVVTLRNNNKYVVMRDYCDSWNMIHNGDKSDNENLSVPGQSSTPEFHCEDILWSPGGCVSMAHYSSEMNYIVDSAQDALSPSLDEASPAKLKIREDHPYDIADVYISDFNNEFFDKQPGRGRILWRNEPFSVTYRRGVMDVPPFIHRKTEYPLAPEGTRPCWVSDENWNKLRADGVLGESLKIQYNEEQAKAGKTAPPRIDPETGLIIGSLEYLYYCETGIILGADT